MSQSGICIDTETCKENEGRILVWGDPQSCSPLYIPPLGLRRGMFVKKRGTESVPLAFLPTALFETYASFFTFAFFILSPKPSNI